MKAIRVVALDIDGVLTDGTALLGSQGVGTKRFSFHDLDGVTAVRREGLQIVLVTGEDDETVTEIARRFGIDRVVRGAKDKAAVLKDLVSEFGCELDEMCYVGDSDRDAAALKIVGLGLAPQNATPAAKAAAHRLLKASGGDGAVAEAIRLVFDFNGHVLERDRDLSTIRLIVSESIDAHQCMLKESLLTMLDVSRRMASAIMSGRKVLLFGNGGSAADAQHVAAELVGRFATDSDPWPAISLASDSSVLTCIANDWNFEEVFSRQVRALARAGDVVVGISTSGRSANVLRALEAAHGLGAVTVGFTGRIAGPIGDLCDVCFAAPGVGAARIQELHILAWHAICQQVETELMRRREGRA